MISSRNSTRAHEMTTHSAPSPESTRMFAEAAEASSVIAAQLRANAPIMSELARDLRDNPPRAVVTFGRGSSDHAALYGRYLMETRLGVLTSSAGLSVSSVYQASPSLKGALGLAVSQSGKSPDLLASVKAARDAGARIVALVNDPDSPLAAAADVTIPLHAGPERSVAATKSCIAALTALANLVTEWSDDADLRGALAALPAQLAQAWSLDWSEGVDALRTATNLYVLGRGVGFGIANEAALKFKETCGLHAEAFSAAEVLHGPMALVKPGFPVLVFSQNDETAAGVRRMADDMATRGARVLMAAPGGDGGLPVIAGHPALEPILMIQSFYRMANALSVARGHDPDRPPHLNKVTETV